MDPKSPDVLYAAAYQRRRAVGQLIGGGPESGIYKSTDGGQKWTKLTKGLPTVELGRIGLGDQLAEPAHGLRARHAQLGQGGFFRSDDAGATWTRIGRMQALAAAAGRARPGGTRAGAPAGRSIPAPAKPSGERPQGGRGGGSDDCYRGGDPGYYNEIYVDAHDPETIWSLQTNVDRSTDGGKTWRRCRCPACTSITTTSCSIRPTRTTSSSPTTAASTRPTTA